MASKNNNSYSLLEFFFDSLFIVLSIAVPVVLYLLFSYITGISYILEWDRGFKVYFVVYTLLFPLVITVNYNLSNSYVDTHKKISKLINFNELENEKYLDCIFSHYTNMTTVALIGMVGVYLIRPYSEIFDGIFIGIIMFGLVVIMIFSYILIFTKTMIGLKKFGEKCFIPTSIFLFFIDSHVVKLLVSSV